LWAGYEATVKGLAFLAAAPIQRGRTEERVVCERESKQSLNVKEGLMSLVR
jgi:hypothetical protein